MISVFYLSSACWQWQKNYVRELCVRWTDLSTSQGGIAKGRLLRRDFEKIVRTSTQEKRSSENLSLWKIYWEKTLLQTAISFGSLVPQVRVQGLQVALDIYSSLFRGLMGEIGRDCPAVMGFQIISPVQPFIRIEELTAVAHNVQTSEQHFSHCCWLLVSSQEVSPTKRRVVQKNSYLSPMDRFFKEPQKCIYIHCYC